MSATYSFMKGLLGDVPDASRPRLAETANYPQTPVTKLACLYLAIGLQVLAGKGEAQGIARRFVQQMERFVTPADFTKYKIPAAYVVGYDDPGVSQSLIKELKTRVRKIINDRSVSTEELNFLKFSLLFAEDPDKRPNYVERAKKMALKVSTAYYRNFTKVVDHVHEATSSNKVSVQAIQTELAELVSELTGKKLDKNVLDVPTKLIQELRVSTKSTSKLEQVKRYKELRRDLVIALDNAMASFIAKNDGKVYIHELNEYTEKLGFKIRRVPKTTKKIPLKVGFFGGKLKYYTDDDRPIEQGIPSIAKDIKFPKTYDKKTGTGAYLTYTSDLAFGITRVYTEAHVAKRVEKISSATKAVSTKIDSVLARWKKDLTSPDPIKKMGATAAVMIYLTAMRVGARQTTAASNTGVPTYGGISLRPRHITLRKGGIFIKYKGKSSGKSGVEQKHLIKVTSDPLTKRLYNNLAELLKGKKGDTLVFSMKAKRGKDVVLTYTRFRDYIKNSGYPAGIHKMRRVRGTNLMIELLKTTKWKPSAQAKGKIAKEQKEAENYAIQKVLIPIANLLGHKSGTGADLWRTTAKSYIEPEPLVKFFETNNLRIPKWLPKTASGE